MSRQIRLANWIVRLSSCLWLLSISPVSAQDRALGLDASAWQGNISQMTWNNIRNVENREFVFIRSSRGGTTGFYNQSDPNNNRNRNTLSQRYDDPYFVQNMTRATNAGMLAGPYHFSRADIVASTQNSAGVANSGADEADHFIQMAGAWMRPGYLLPVHDLEAGDGFRSDNDMAQFALDFSNRIFEVMGIRPAMYTNGNYANFVIGGASPSLRNQVVENYPTLWSARWPNQNNPDSIPVQTGHPKDSYAPIYGPWDDPPKSTHPWSFWQYASTGRLGSFNNGNSNLDLNVAQGGLEFLKDRLVPALWLSDADGEWTSLDRWNSGQTPIVPVQGPGQASRVGPLTLPGARLPGADDTVILDRPAADVTITISSGLHTIRKLQVREALNITGGSLQVNYVPSADSTPTSARFSAPVSVVAGGHLSLHTLQVDAGQAFTLGGSLTLDTMQLMPHISSPAVLNIVDDVTVSAFANNTAVIANGSGSGNSGRIDMGGTNRVWTVQDGSATVDLSIDVPLTNGRLFKSGAGTLELTSSSAYAGDIVVQEGTLKIDDGFLADTADVFLSAEARLNLDFTGPYDVVRSAYVDGIALPAGTWGAPGSGAQFTSPIFTGTGTLLVIQYEPLLLGDYSGNGIVDGADFTFWRDSLGITGLKPFTGADGTGDGAVTVADLAIWETNYGATEPAGGSGQFIPEPQGWLCCWWAALLLGMTHRRRQLP